MKPILGQTTVKLAYQSSAQFMLGVHQGESKVLFVIA